MLNVGVVEECDDERLTELAVASRFCMNNIVGIRANKLGKLASKLLALKKTENLYYERRVHEDRDECCRTA